MYLNDELPARRDDSLDYRRIARDAKLAALEDAGAPIPVGRQVAWSTSRGMQGSHTDDFSLVHRAAPTTEPTDEGQSAFCGERIAHAVRRVSLSPRLIVSLGVCRFCDEDYTHHIAQGGDSNV